MKPDAPRPAVPQIHELTCLTQDQRIAHARHGWKWRAVEIWCPGIPEPPDLPDVKGEDVPPQIVEAAQRGYSMHGAGLVANLIAAAWPEIERQVRTEAAAEIEARAATYADTPTGPRASFRRGMLAAARHIAPTPTPQEIADALASGHVVFCNPPDGGPNETARGDQP